jgi:hypothetical protein
MMLRAKFFVESVTSMKDSEVVELRPVYGDTPENKSWSKWTPSGKLSMTINNPAAMGVLKPGQEYWLDLAPVQQSG